MRDKAYLIYSKNIGFRGYFMPHYWNFNRSNSSSISIDLTITSIATELSILQLNIKNPAAIIDDPHELGYRLESLLEDLNIINRALPHLSKEGEVLIDRHQIDTQD
jgi:hypothetical protein